MGLKQVSKEEVVNKLPEEDKNILNATKKEPVFEAEIVGDLEEDDLLEIEILLHKGNRVGLFRSKK